jgi:glycosyltransferase involved in cell wall biosynthesis
MTIGIDGNEANVDAPVGVSVYTLNLLNYFQKKAATNLQFKIYLRENPKNFLPPETKFFKYIVIPARRFWLQIFFPVHLLTHRDIDVLFSPAHYTPRFCPVPQVVTIHDLSHFYFPDEFLKGDLYKLTRWTKFAVQKARKIIAVSKNTKKDLAKFYNLPEEKISIIYNGYEKRVHTGSKFQAPGSKYILYVGTLQPRKNVQTLIRTFEKFHKTNPDFKLVITGKKGWLYKEIFSLVKDLHLEKSVIFTGHVSEDELTGLYRNAFCFVLPSLYEGFGIPVLEAMSYRCPVICSNSSSLPEVGGDAALYFNPQDEIQLLNQLKRLKGDPKLREELISRGLKRIKLFSWQKSAKETLEVIKSSLE